MPIPSIKSVMTPFPYSVAPSATTREAEAMMRDHGIHHLPVKEHDELVGVVAASDLRRARGAATRVAEVMRTDPYVVGLASPLDDVLLHMADHHVECVLVTKGDRLAGIFTVVDACRAFGRELRERRPGGGDAA